MRPLLSLLFLLKLLCTSAQPVVHANGFAYNGGRIDDIDHDAAGNVYICGTFVDSADMDPSASTLFLQAQGVDGFLAKYNDQGALLWAKHLNFMNYSYALACDPDGDVYVVMSGTGAALYKYDPSGTELWAIEVGTFFQGTLEDVDRAPNGDVVVTGSVRQSTDVDPGTGVTLLQPEQPGTDAGFFVRYTENGSLVSARILDGVGASYPQEVQCDNAGNILITGWITGGEVDLDPSAGAAPQPSPAFGHPYFLAKYDPVGDFLWGFAVQCETIAFTKPRIRIAPNNDVFTCATFQDSGDFDPGAGTFTLAADSYDGFVARYTASGELQWAFKVVNPLFCTSSVAGVELTSAGTLVAAGTYCSDGRFDHEDLTQTWPNPSGSDIYLCTYNAGSGSLASVTVLPYTGTASMQALDMTPDDDLIIQGTFNVGPYDFDPGPGTVELDLLPPQFNSTYYVVRYSGIDLLTHADQTTPPEACVQLRPLADGLLLVADAAWTGSTITLRDVTGRTVHTGRLNGEQALLPLPAATGTYWATIHGRAGTCARAITVLR